MSLDIVAYLGYFDKKKFTALNANGTVTHSFSTFENDIRQQFPTIKRYLSLEFSNVKITIIDQKTAILVNEYKADLVLQSGQEVSAYGAGTQVWALSDQDWKLVSISSSNNTERETLD